MTGLRRLKFPQAPQLLLPKYTARTRLTQGDNINCSKECAEYHYLQTKNRV